MKFFESIKFTNLFSKKKIDDNLLNKFEELLIEADVGSEVAAELKQKFKEYKIGKEIKNEKEIFDFLSEQISKILKPFEKSFDDFSINLPSIILVAGVNGVGKTTTIGKLGRLFKNSGKKIVFGAATTGQNAISQVEEFKKISNITSLIITKLDTTAKGGIILSICKKFRIPILAVGLGEKESDLHPFSSKKFSKMLLGN